MDVNPIQSGAAQTAAPTTTRTEISSDFETFLRMLTVQMQNQDPLNPVDSSDYAVQLATFSSVEQQVQTNVQPGADNAQIIVRDATNDEVGRLTIPTDGAPIEWAGVTADGYPYPPGTYSFEVVSYSGEEVIGTGPAATYSTITEVQRDNAGNAIVVLNGGSAISADEVTALRNPALPLSS